jgi:hypothetical protein
MVAYRLSAQVIGRSTGRSATGAAAYRAACRIEDERTGLIRDYTRKGGVLHTEILAPENAPDWMRDRAKLWNAIELAEKRKDAQLCREILLNLPHELTQEQQIELVREFVRDRCVALGMIADIAIHAAHKKGDHRNTHAHVMLSMREATPDGFGQKVRDWNSPELLEKWREEWARCQNRALERAGRSERVDHRSLEAQGIDREPEPKQGPVATRMEREGRPSKAGDDRRAAKERNQQREELKAEAKIIDFELARIEREEQRNERRRGQPVPPASPEMQAAEKARFEEWANVRRAELQNARHEAEGEQGRTHERERLALRNEQAISYGTLKKQAAATLAAIAKRQQERKGLGSILSRLSGAARRDSERAGLERATLANIEARENEQNGALTARQQAEKANLSGEHAQEQARLEQRIEHARDRREREGWQPHRETRREAAGHEIDREAENSPVEGREAGTGETTPEHEQAPTASPEAAQQGKKPEAEAERQAAIDAERQRLEEQDRRYAEEQERERTPEEREAAIEARRERWRRERDRGDDDGGRGRERTR